MAALPQRHLYGAQWGVDGRRVFPTQGRRDSPRLDPLPAAHLHATVGGGARRGGARGGRRRGRRRGQRRRPGRRLCRCRDAPRRAAGRAEKVAPPVWRPSRLGQRVGRARLQLLGRRAAVRAGAPRRQARLPHYGRAVGLLLGGLGGEHLLPRPRGVAPVVPAARLRGADGLHPGRRVGPPAAAARRYGRLGRVYGVDAAGRHCGH
ncbi:hypothetical protein BU14_2465s0001 [Porphyra umbilicalis]|uniref:Uncharacterized protein n=1 Tax=Porphyra umbilicalis TaxID=2786 RepID=A0A1X6NJ35_PORUM|nr:hypothetical protein BU14_2465s0001 [Porphyra umbilicalis]|eukprot:OSX68634.1 hypothetical protein BU14_2465s0001 [Porphyra umbilicalis]